MISSAKAVRAVCMAAWVPITLRWLLRSCLSSASTDNRRRFKNETQFLLRHKHNNIVSVIDHGLAREPQIEGPFYVMRRYECNVRHLIEKGIKPADVLPIFVQLLDGVEAAHLHKVVHRDLKPENFLVDQGGKRIAVADFGIASFTDEVVATLVDTAPTKRLANFQYAAPEQRRQGAEVTVTTDIYALGLVLNEMFTGRVPHGTEYRSIASLSENHAYLDSVVSAMLRQAPDQRPISIAAVKTLIQQFNSEATTLQRISDISGTVVPIDEIDEPLAHEPPRLIGADWNNGRLTLTLDRPVNDNWMWALRNLGSYSSVMGIGPETFSARDKTVSVPAGAGDVQAVVDHFKNWLPRVTQVLKHRLAQEAQQKERERQERLRRERNAAEEKLRVNRSIRI